MTADPSPAEPSQYSAWIFQGNPKLYDVIGAVEGKQVVTWAVNQYQQRIKKGDRAYLWVSGQDAGIVATGTILDDPREHEPDPLDPYPRVETWRNEPYLAVDIRINRKLTESRVLRSVLLADERTRRMGVLTFPSATNYGVRPSEEAVIKDILDRTYMAVPAAAEPSTQVPRGVHYWIYSPGQQASYWDEFYADGIMAIGWDQVGDLTRCDSRDELRMALADGADDSASYRNQTLALWQFARDMAVGDVVFVKRGLRTIVGRGEVASDYFFDAERATYRQVRKVVWTDHGEWQHPGQATPKTLTDVTRYTEYVRQLEALFDREATDRPASPEIEAEIEPYLPEDFLREVYLGADQFATLRDLVLRKKNVILQGAPGVGKTFAARRLAYALMGEKDPDRVMMVQFHQSFSYEDFIMGYRPDGTGFSRTPGPFYEFCDKARDDPENRYFFIIDEINRGNLSKVFGELLMLIEPDKRGERNALRLMYSDERFWVPDNLYLIGMMNTADRSLALIDYALRRRFAFFDMEPAFSSDGFVADHAAVMHPGFTSLVRTLERLNLAIAQDPSLGPGFRIGHSYLCTGVDIDDVFLSSVVEYEVIPLLREYWFDTPETVEQWAAHLRAAIKA